MFGNSIAIASFAEPAAELRIESNLQLETYVVKRPAFQITPEAASYPFIYSADDRIDLGRMLERHHPDPADRLGAWARGFIRSNPTDTLALLADLNNGVTGWISYQSRETEGTQTPVETLDRGWGSCRDLAVLLIEAARSLGFGARIVTGYLYNPAADAAGRSFHSPARPTVTARATGARLGRHLSSRCRLDCLRPDEPDDRRRRLDTRCGHPRHQPGGADRGKFCRRDQRLSRHDGRRIGDFGNPRTGKNGFSLLTVIRQRNRARCSDVLELAFPHDALVRLAAALDAVLELAIAAR